MKQTFSTLHLESKVSLNPSFAQVKKDAAEMLQNRCRNFSPGICQQMCKEMIVKGSDGTTKRKISVYDNGNLKWKQGAAYME